MDSDDRPVVFDAADATWGTGPLRNGTLIIGEFTVIISDDTIAIMADDDAVVIPLDDGGSPIEEVSGEGYTRTGDGATSWSTVTIGLGSGTLFLPDDDETEDDDEPF